MATASSAQRPSCSASVPHDACAAALPFSADTLTPDSTSVATSEGVGSVASLTGVCARATLVIAAAPADAPCYKRQPHAPQPGRRVARVLRCASARKRLRSPELLVPLLARSSAIATLRAAGGSVSEAPFGASALPPACGVRLGQRQRVTELRRICKQLCAQAVLHAVLITALPPRSNGCLVTTRLTTYSPKSFSGFGVFRPGAVLQRRCACTSHDRCGSRARLAQAQRSYDAPAAAPPPSGPPVAPEVRPGGAHAGAASSRPSTLKVQHAMQAHSSPRRFRLVAASRTRGRVVPGVPGVRLLHPTASRIRASRRALSATARVWA
jgi:hypothetical protein